MKQCTLCHKKMYQNTQADSCLACRMSDTKCECGATKDWRAAKCRSCASVANATRQWQRMRPRLEKSLRAFAATRKGKRLKEPVKCSITDCDRFVEARGWCHRHYANWKHSGRPEKISDTERFWANIKKTKSCWIWTGSKNELGYGIASFKGKKVRAHRLSYFFEYGEYPMPVGRHTCDTPACVRPDHIIPGTQADNMRDCIERGRNAKGSRMSTAKLNEAQVAEIKKELQAGIFQKVIAKRFNVDQTTICNINTGDTWAHVQI